MQEIIDADFEEIDIIPPTPLSETSIVDTRVPSKLSKSQITSALKGAVATGDISSSRAKEIRLEMGIRQSDFTKTHVNKKERKNKRNAQKQSRKNNRK